jgi:hypothetical protein
MQNVYLVRTAAVASIAALFLGVGWMEMQGDAMQVAPEMVAVSGALAEPAGYFPAGFQLQPNAHEPEAYEYF